MGRFSKGLEIGADSLSRDRDSRPEAAAAPVVDQQDCDGQDNHQKYDVGKIKLHSGISLISYGLY